MRQYCSVENIPRGCVLVIISVLHAYWTTILGTVLATDVDSVSISCFRVQLYSANEGVQWARRVRLPTPYKNSPRKSGHPAPRSNTHLWLSEGNLHGQVVPPRQPLQADPWY